MRDEVLARTALPWGEHCTECVWPTCYTTCDLYTPREDGACRQFIDGMVRLDHAEGTNPYVLKIRFKPWAKLWTVGNLDLQPPSRVHVRERLNIVIGAIGRTAPLPAALRPRVLSKLNYIRRRSAEAARATEHPADVFMIECYNPHAHVIDLTLSIRTAFGNAQVFQHLIPVPPGYTRAEVAVSEISRAVDLKKPFEVEIVPNGSEDTALYFGLMDFVELRSRRDVPHGSQAGLQHAKKWKCLVWDLDNTLWDGTLVEDGPERLRIRPRAVEVVKEADRRGILQSIASKNSHDEAMNVLRRAGLDQYFLHPQIVWRPKSDGISRIAKLLNIGIDTLAFVDDQPFERAEVTSVLPQVDVIDAAEIDRILQRPELDVPVTADGARRRLLYREQEVRQAALESAGGDYMEFLKACQLKVGIKPLDASNLRRVYELAQRTNQLNFSGNRYGEDQLRQMMSSSRFATYVIECSDRFGDYGIVGFAIVDTTAPRLLDLMFSCRVQGKRVEHAVLGYLIREFHAGGAHEFHANYRRTAKNAPGGQVFHEIGFEVVAETDGVSSLLFPIGRSVPQDGVIEIVLERSPRLEGSRVSQGSHA
jgi:FkbH-like protein